MQDMPSVFSIAVYGKGMGSVTWKEVLGLVLCVVEDDVVSCRVEYPVILQQVQVVLQLSIHSEDESTRGLSLDGVYLLGVDCDSVEA